MTGLRCAWQMHPFQVDSIIWCRCYIFRLLSKTFIDSGFLWMNYSKIILGCAISTFCNNVKVLPTLSYQCFDYTGSKIPLSFYIFLFVCFTNILFFMKSDKVYSKTRFRAYSHLLWYYNNNVKDWMCWILQFISCNIIFQ